MKQRVRWVALALAVLLGGLWGCAPSLEELRRTAQQGDAQAQFDLGARYFDGRGVVRDRAEAAL